MILQERVMQARALVPVLALLLVALAGCDGRTGKVDHSNNTAVLGSNGLPPDRGAAAPLADAQGQAIPAPPAPAAARAQAVLSGADSALAVWVADDHVVASGWSRATGWSAPQALERIYGASSDPQIVSNGRGSAMVVWQHRVGNIHSLRFSRFEAASGWSLPDVLPGAMPRPHAAGAPANGDAPQLQMDAAGNVLARWPSGFHANETQVARYTPGQGWSAAASEPVASATPASPAPRAPSSAR
jgi:hypothetical protein